MLSTGATYTYTGPVLCCSIWVATRHTPLNSFSNKNDKCHFSCEQGASTTNRNYLKQYFWASAAILALYSRMTALAQKKRTSVLQLLFSAIVHNIIPLDKIDSRGKVNNLRKASADMPHLLTNSVSSLSSIIQCLTLDNKGPRGMLWYKSCTSTLKKLHLPGLDVLKYDTNTSECQVVLDSTAYNQLPRDPSWCYYLILLKLKHG